MKKKPDHIAVFAKYIPLLSILVIACAALTTMMTYRSFSIDVLAYLDLTEIIMISLNTFITICVLAVIFYVGILCYKSMGLGRYLALSYHQQSFYKAFFNNFVVKIISILTIVSISIGSFAYNCGYMDHKVFYSLLNVTLVAYGITLIFHLVTISHYRLYKSEVDIDILIFCCFATLAFSYATLNGMYKNKFYKENNSYLKNSIIFDKQLIKSSTTYYFLLKTNKFVFFYNEKDSTTDVFPIEKVEKLTISK